MTRDLRFVLVIFCATTAGLLVSACQAAGESTAEDESLIQELEAAGGELMEETAGVSSKEDVQAPHSASLCCWGHCNSSGAFHSGLISSGCRDWVIDRCHSSGLAFHPNGDAWWGSCP